MMLTKANLEVAGQKLLLLLRRSFAILLAMAALFIGLGLLLSPPKELAVGIVLLVFLCAFAVGAFMLWPHASRYIASTSIEARLGKFAEASCTRSLERADRLTIRNEHPQPNPLSSREQIELPTLSDLILALNDFSHEDGPATENQRAAVERLGLGEPPIDLSFEQAHALLSARNYVRGVLYRVGQSLDRENWHQFETHLVAFVAKNPPLLTRAIAWSDRSFARGRGEIPTPKRDEYWDAVVIEAKRLLALVA
jgi:hypothetical protein